MYYSFELGFLFFSRYIKYCEMPKSANLNAQKNCKSLEGGVELSKYIRKNCKSYYVQKKCKSLWVGILLPFNKRIPLFHLCGPTEVQTDRQN